LEVIQIVNNFSLLQSMPISYNSLVIENTTRCTAECSICYQSVGPKGKDENGLLNLSSKTMEKVIEDAIQMPNLQPRFHLGGGESFLNPEECIHLFQFAKACGYREISAVTNAFWAKSKRKAEELTCRLRQAGLLRIEISWDYWHAPYIIPSAINNAIKACHNADIQVTLRVLSSRSHHAGEALSFLNSDVCNLVSVMVCSPLMHSGRAKNNILVEDVYPFEDMSVGCHHSLNLTVNPSGYVSPCCSGFDQTNTIVFGNVHDESIVTIANRMNRLLLLRMLVFQGIGSLLPILEDAGIDKKTNATSICQLCWDIFTDKTSAFLIKEYFDKLDAARIQKYVDNLSAENTLVVSNI